MPTYSDERGHPRLRMGHVPFKVGPIERDAWLRAMHIAVAEIEPEVLDDAHRRQLLEYFDMAANSLMNLDGLLGHAHQHAHRVRLMQVPAARIGRAARRRPRKTS